MLGLSHWAKVYFEYVSHYFEELCNYLLNTNSLF